MAATNVSFNGNSLQTATILTSDIDHHGSPEINLKAYNMAHANAVAMPYVDWPKKIITISGKLIGSSVAAVDALEDTFKGYLTGRNANLDIDFAGSTRRYVGNVTKIAIKRPQGLFYGNFTAEFTCQPFGMDTSSTSLFNAVGVTTSTSNQTPTFGGTAPYQYPIYTLTMTTVGGSPVVGTVSVGNNTNGQQVNITRTWTSGEVLTIDLTQLLNTQGVSTPITVGGNPVAFTGAFPEFAGGAAASIGYADTFASRTITFAAVNTNRYL